MAELPPTFEIRVPCLSCGEAITLTVHTSADAQDRAPVVTLAVPEAAVRDAVRTHLAQAHPEAAHDRTPPAP